MAKPERTRSERMAIRAQAQRSPAPEIFNSALELLRCLAGMPGGGTADRAFLQAAHYLASSVTSYAETVRAGLPHTSRDTEEMTSYREQQADKLESLAGQMLEIMRHPATEQLILPADDGFALGALLQNLLDIRTTTTPSSVAKARREDARVRLGVTAKAGKGVPKGNRWEICNAIAHAWLVATNSDIRGRNMEKSGEKPYGEFHNFIKSVLDLTGETNDMNVDEVHRAILEMGK